MKGSVVNVKAKYSCLHRVRSVTHHQRLRLERLLLGYALSFGPGEELGGFDHDGIQAILNHAETIYYSVDDVYHRTMLSENQTDKVLHGYV